MFRLIGLMYSKQKEVDKYLKLNRGFTKGTDFTQYLSKDYIDCYP